MNPSNLTRNLQRVISPKFIMSAVVMAGFFPPALCPATQVVPGSRPAVLANLSPLGELDPSTSLSLTIGLRLRDQAGLSAFLKQLYNPASPNYRHFLSPSEFTERFGPTEQDYRALIDFVQAQGLKISATHPNRLLLDVTGPVGGIEKALHVRMRLYQHPVESRTFYAPDSEPSLDVAVPVLSIGGLDNFALPKPRLVARKLTGSPTPSAGLVNPGMPHMQNASGVSPTPLSGTNSGSGPQGTYMGKDFGAAYLPDSTLTGNGQNVGLLEFDGYTASDIAFYVAKAGIPSVALTNVLLDGFSGNPTGSGGEIEVSLDIEVALSLASGLTSIIVYEAGPSGSWHDMLNRMASDNLAKQLSCSWYIPGGGADPTADQIWQEMAAQGQSFLNASGDSDAYTGSISFPGDSPYITQVGGTTLTTSGPDGAWVSERVWNWGNGIGSSGGVSTFYKIPYWQTNVSMALNKGSTTMRNTPDVALTADNVYVRADDGDWDVGGTSCAAPLWAAFIALANEQATESGAPTLGFLNPGLYAIGIGPWYGSVFHDITTGNNQRPGSGTDFSAVSGYDLCTGWGTPPGQSLINILVGPPVPTPPAIIAQPQSLTVASGTNATFAVSAYGSYPMSFQWTFDGTNIAGATDASLTLNNLQVSQSGNYAVIVTNAYGATNSTNALLTVRNLPPTITTQPTNVSIYATLSATFTAAATGSEPLFYQWVFNGTNPITGATNTALVLRNLQFSNAGLYSLVVTNLYGSTSSVAAALNVLPPPPCAPPAAGLISWWKAEDNALDFVSGNNGILENGAGFVQGEVGQSFSLNGINNFILVNPTTSLDVGLGSGLTFEGWINPATLGQEQILIEYERALGTGNGNDVGMGMDLHATATNGLVFVNLKDITGVDHIYTSSDSILAPNVWQHLALTYDAGSGLSVIYINGTAVSQTNLGSFTPQTSYTNFVIGARTTFGSVSYPVAPYFGAIDELSIYGRALGPSEILAIYNASISGKCFSPTPPLIVAQPTNTTAVAGYSAAFAVTAAGTPPLSYQWSYNGTNVIAGATNASLVLTDVQLANAGSYSVTVSSPYGVTNSGSAVLTVEVAPPSITAEPTNETVLEGAVANFTVGAAGTPPLTYQWFFNGTNPIAGATNASLVLPNVQFTNAGAYSVNIASPYGSTNSTSAELTVTPPPPCDPPPSGIISWWRAEYNALDAVGGNNGILENGTGFTTGEVGTGFSLNGLSNFILVNPGPNLNLTSDTGLTIEGWIEPSTLAQEQIVMEYERALGTGSGNDVGMGIDLHATATNGIVFVNLKDVNEVDHIYTSPDGLLVTGVWQHFALTYDQGSGISVIYINGAAVLQTNLGSFTPQSSYTNLVFGARTTFGSISSPVAPFSGGLDELSIYGRALGASEVAAIYNAATGGKCFVATPPTITAEPTNTIATEGETVQFSVIVAGSPPLDFQWFYNGTNQIAGATNSILTLNNVQLANEGAYSVAISNPYGSTNSTAALLTVQGKPPFISGQPIGETAAVGGTASFAVTAAGSPPLAYQWTFNVTNAIPNATNASLVLTNIQLTNAGTYSVNVSNSFGSTNSAGAVLTVVTGSPCDPPPAGLISWWKGENNALDVVSGNNGILENGTGFGPGEVGNGFSLNGANNFILVNPAGNLNIGLDGGFTIEGWLKPTVLTQEQIIMEYERALGTGSGSDVGMGLAIHSAAPSGVLYVDVKDASQVDHIFTTAPNLLAAGVWQHVALTYDKSSGLSVAYINGTAVLQTNIGSITPLTSFTNLLIGARTTFASVSSPLAPFYGGIDEWSIYGRSLSASEVMAIYNAGSAGKCTTPSPPVIETEPTNETVNLGGTAIFSVSAVGASPLTFQWEFNGTNPLVGATNASLVLTNVQLTNQGTYSVSVSNPYGETNSTPALLTVNPPPPCDPAPAGLISWWKGEDNGVDAVGRNDGILENATGFMKGEVGQAFNLNGINDFILVNPSTNLNVGLGDGLTIEGWIAPTTLTQEQIIMEYEAALGTGSGSDVGMGFAIHSAAPSGVLYINLRDTNELDHIFTSAPNLLIPGVWQHIALTYNRSSGLSFVYINGVAVLQTNLGSFSPQTSYSNLLIGARTTFGSVSSPVAPFSGGIDEFSIYARDLASNELAAIYQAGSSGKCYDTAPYFLTQPISQALLAGGNAVFTAVATGSNPLSYQWFYNGTNLLAGATQSTLIVTNIQASETGEYSVLVSNVFGSAMSSNAILTVLSPPIIHDQPLTQWAVPGCTVSFFVTAKGTLPLRYQWFENSFALAGQTNPTLTLLNVQASNFTSYYVLLANSYGTVTSSIASLSYERPPTAPAQTVDRFVEGGVRASTSQLLAKVTAYDGYGLSVIGVSSNSTAGGAVSLMGGNIFYAPPSPPPTNSDSFTYTVSDGECGGTAAGTVTIQTKPDSVLPLNFGIQNQGKGSFLMSFDGIPGYTYEIQYVDSLSGTNWQSLAVVTADQYGVCQFADAPTTNVPARFYRAQSLLGTLNR